MLVLLATLNQRDNQSEPKGFTPNTIPNIFDQYSGKNWEVKRKGKTI
jgi:hypothetical protein